MLIQLESIETGNVYNINAAEITQDMTASTGEVIVNQITQATETFNLWTWYNEAKQSGLFVGTPNLLQLKTARGYPFNPPFTPNTIPGTAGASDLVSIFKADYSLRGIPFRQAYKPGANVNPINVYNETMFKIVMRSGYNGPDIFVGVGMSFLAGADQYETTGPNPLFKYYSLDAANDWSCVCNVLMWIVTGNDVCTIDRHGTDNILDHEYAPGSSGCSRIGPVQSFLIYDEFAKYESNVYQVPDSVVPTIYLATPQQAEDDNLSEANAARYIGPSMGVLSLSDDANDHLAATAAETDPMGLPGLENFIGANSTGFVSVYVMTLNGLQNLSRWFWDKSISAAIRDFFSNPTEAIVSMHILPLGILEAGELANDVHVMFGNVDSNVLANGYARDVAIKDCGTVTISPYFNNFLDYQTELTIYIPYVGYQPLDVHRFMGKTVGLAYYIDPLTGTAVAFILDENKKIVQQFEAEMCRRLPMSAADYSDVVRNLLSAVGSLAGGFGGAVGQMAGGKETAASLSLAGGIAGTLQSGAGAFASMAYPSISTFNGVSSAPAQMSSQTPHVIISRPDSPTSGAYSDILGLPDTTATSLSSISGFCQVLEPELKDFDGTSEDYAEIKRLLEGGVIF